MAGFSTDVILSTVSDALAMVTDCFNRCFDDAVDLEFGQAQDWTKAVGDERLQKPGLSLHLSILTGTASRPVEMLALIPDTLMPAWYLTPDDSQGPRLGTLGMEWAMLLLPEDYQDGNFSNAASPNLMLTLQACDPLDECVWMTLDVLRQGSNVGQIHLFCPVASSFEEVPAAAQSAPAANADPDLIDPAELEAMMSGAASPPRAQSPVSKPAVDSDMLDPAEIEAMMASASSKPAAAKPAAPQPSASKPAASPQVAAAAAAPPAPKEPEKPTGPTPRERLHRLMKLEVPVSVRLAEKRITMGQLINIGPGGLITFPKSCDDLLDLYVNNRLYAKGEAVKIGEKFGIKINEVGVENLRASGVFSL